MAVENDASAAPGSALRTRSLAIAALIVAAGFLGSRVLGLLRSVIIARTYGTEPELDAYFVAFRLPDLVFQLLAGATLASAFIPTFANTRADEGEAASWRLASSVLNLLFVATAVFAFVAFLLAPQLVPLLAPGLGEGTGREAELNDLAIDLTRVMLISPVLFAISGMFMGILNARRHFLTPALAPMFYNAAIIAAALLSTDVRMLAIAVVAGAALHLAVQLPDLKLAGMAYSLVANWKDAAVREVGALMGPRVIGLAATQVNFYFIAIFFASRLGEGAISAVSFAWLIVMTPLGVIGMAISTAAFPTLAEHAANDDDRLTPTLRSALRLILFLALPAGIGLMLLAKPLIVVALQRGAFDVASTDLTAQALLFYAFGVFAHSGIEILSRGFYVYEDTRTPVAVAVGSMLLNLLLATLLVVVLDLEVRGLALALSLSTTCEFLTLFVLLSRRMPGLVDATLLSSLARMVLSAALMAAVVGGVVLVLGSRFDLDRLGPALVELVLSAGAGALTYLIATMLLRLDEPRQLIARIRRRGADAPATA
jgi:putative peptidoglycan lipid II flippase